jgi:predicted transcriptional regulator
MPSRAQPTSVSLGPLEAEVMGLMWKGGLRTVAEVTQRVNEGRPQPLDYRTILTIMSRLTKKKLLRHRRRGNTYLFSVTCTEGEFAARQAAAAVVELVERYGEPALAGILDQLVATPEAIARLTALVGTQDGQGRHEEEKQN